ncbi:hypothetical protein D3C73_1151950 [compost metagenome]
MVHMQDSRFKVEVLPLEACCFTRAEPHLQGQQPARFIPSAGHSCVECLQVSFGQCLSLAWPYRWRLYQRGDVPEDVPAPDCVLQGHPDYRVRLMPRGSRQPILLHLGVEPFEVLDGELIQAQRVDGLHVGLDVVAVSGGRGWPVFGDAHPVLQPLQHCGRLAH